MSKQKTPMMQLLDKLKYARVQLAHGYPQDEQFDEGYANCLTNIINDIELQMIPIEKEYITSMLKTVEASVIIETNNFGHKKEDILAIKDVTDVIDTTAHLVDKHGQLDDAGAYAEDDKED